MKKDLVSKRPIAPVIAARLCKEWGGRIALLFKQGDLYFEDGEEVPFAAIESWQEISLPEVESEDERIMEAIKGAIHTATMDEKTRKDAIAYLEKQKNSKSKVEYVYPKFRVGDEILEINPNGYCIPVIVKYIGDGSYKCESYDKKRFLSFPIKSEDEYRLVEPKPVEWSKEDEENLDAAIDIAEHSLYEPLVPRDTLVHFLKSLRPQPKQEWSEEDKKYFQWLCMIIKTKQLEKVITLKEESKIIRWMNKWLNYDPTSRHEAQVFTKEDRGMLDCIIAILCEDGKHEQNKHQIDFLNRLKNKIK